MDFFGMRAAMQQHDDKATVMARIEGLMAERGIRSDRELSIKATGKHFTMRNLRQSAKLNFETVADLAPALGTTPQFLFFGVAGHGTQGGTLPAGMTLDAGRQVVMMDACASDPDDRPIGIERRPSWPPMNNVPVIGEVAAGHWRDVDTEVDAPIYDDVPVPADPSYPIEAQFAVVVRGTSINRVARDGSVLGCVDVRKARVHPRNNDLVIVEQTRDGGHQIMRTAKRYHEVGDHFELRPDSDDPRWTKAIVVQNDAEEEGTSIAVIGIALGVYSSMKVLDRHRDRAD